MKIDRISFFFLLSYGWSLFLPILAWSQDDANNTNEKHPSLSQIQTRNFYTQFSDAYQFKNMEDFRLFLHNHNQKHLDRPDLQYEDLESYRIKHERLHHPSLDEISRSIRVPVSMLDEVYLFSKSDYIDNEENFRTKYSFELEKTDQITFRPSSHREMREKISKHNRWVEKQFYNQRDVLKHLYIETPTDWDRVRHFLKAESIKNIEMELGFIDFDYYTGKENHIRAPGVPRKGSESTFNPQSHEEMRDFVIKHNEAHKNDHEKQIKTSKQWNAWTYTKGTPSTKELISKLGYVDFAYYSGEKDHHSPGRNSKNYQKPNSEGSIGPISLGMKLAQWLGLFGDTKDNFLPNINRELEKELERNKRLDNRFLRWLVDHLPEPILFSLQNAIFDVREGEKNSDITNLERTIAKLLIQNKPEIANRIESRAIIVDQDGIDGSFKVEPRKTPNNKNSKAIPTFIEYMKDIHAEGIRLEVLHALVHNPDSKIIFDPYIKSNGTKSSYSNLFEILLISDQEMNSDNHIEYKNELTEILLEYFRRHFPQEPSKLRYLELQKILELRLGFQKNIDSKYNGTTFKHGFYQKAEILYFYIQQNPRFLLKNKHILDYFVYSARQMKPEHLVQCLNSFYTQLTKYEIDRILNYRSNNLQRNYNTYNRSLINQAIFIGIPIEELKKMFDAGARFIESQKNRYTGHPRSSQDPVEIITNNHHIDQALRLAKYYPDPNTAKEYISFFVFDLGLTPHKDLFVESNLRKYVNHLSRAGFTFNEIEDIVKTMFKNKAKNILNYKKKHQANVYASLAQNLERLRTKQAQEQQMIHEVNPEQEKSSKILYSDNTLNTDLKHKSPLNDHAELTSLVNDIKLEETELGNYEKLNEQERIIRFIKSFVPQAWLDILKETFIFDLILLYERSGQFQTDISHTIDGKTFKLGDLIGFGSHSAVYKIIFDGKPAVLRTSHKNNLDSQTEIKQYLETHALVRSTSNIQIPEIFTFNIEQGWIISEFLDGINVEDTNLLSFLQEHIHLFRKLYEETYQLYTESGVILDIYNPSNLIHMEATLSLADLGPVANFKKDFALKDNFGDQVEAWNKRTKQRFHRKTVLKILNQYRNFKKQLYQFSSAKKHLLTDFSTIVDPKTQMTTSPVRLSTPTSNTQSQIAQSPPASLGISRHSPNNMIPVELDLKGEVTPEKMIRALRVLQANPSWSTTMNASERKMLESYVMEQFEKGFGKLKHHDRVRFLGEVWKGIDPETKRSGRGFQKAGQTAVIAGTEMGKFFGAVYLAMFWKMILDGEFDFEQFSTLGQNLDAVAIDFGIFAGTASGISTLSRLLKERLIVKSESFVSHRIYSLMKQSGYDLSKMKQSYVRGLMDRQAVLFATMLVTHLVKHGYKETFSEKGLMQIAGTQGAFVSTELGFYAVSHLAKRSSVKAVGQAGRRMIFLGSSVGRMTTAGMVYTAFELSVSLLMAQYAGEYFDRLEHKKDSYKAMNRTAYALVGLMSGKPFDKMTMAHCEAFDGSKYQVLAPNKDYYEAMLDRIYDPKQTDDHWQYGRDQYVQCLLSQHELATTAYLQHFDPFEEILKKYHVKLDQLIQNNLEVSGLILGRLGSYQTQLSERELIIPAQLSTEQSMIMDGFMAKVKKLNQAWVGDLEKGPMELAQGKARLKQIREEVSRSQTALRAIDWETCQKDPMPKTAPKLVFNPNLEVPEKLVCLLNNKLAHQWRLYEVLYGRTPNSVRTRNARIEWYTHSNFQKTPMEVIDHLSQMGHVVLHTESVGKHAIKETLLNTITSHIQSTLEAWYPADAIQAYLETDQGIQHQPYSMPAFWNQESKVYGKMVQDEQKRYRMDPETIIQANIKDFNRPLIPARIPEWIEGQKKYGFMPKVDSLILPMVNVSDRGPVDGKKEMAQAIVGQFIQEHVDKFGQKPRRQTIQQKEVQALKALSTDQWWNVFCKESEITEKTCENKFGYVIQVFKKDFKSADLPTASMMGYKGRVVVPQSYFTN